MATLNKVMLIGNVGKDPEVRYFENNKSKSANFTLATTERYTDRNSEKVERTEWHNIACWSRLAEMVESYVKKGSSVYVEGRLRTREWTDRDGNKRYTTEIVADNIQLLGKRGESEDGSRSSYQAAPKASQAPASQNAGTQAPAPAPQPRQAAPAEPQTDAEGGSDDLPF